MQLMVMPLVWLEGCSPTMPSKREFSVNPPSWSIATPICRLSRNSCMLLFYAFKRCPASSNSRIYHHKMYMELVFEFLQKIPNNIHSIVKEYRLGILALMMGLSPMQICLLRDGREVAKVKCCHSWAMNNMLYKKVL